MPVAYPYLALYCTLDAAGRVPQGGDPYLRTGVPALKTTIEIPDELARIAKAHAAGENITLRALIERGLRLALRADRHPGQFELRDASVGGRGLQSPYLDVEWARIREAIYMELWTAGRDFSRFPELAACNPLQG